jgi:asparagine synthase (glutamine-hydrolysing)
MISLYRRVSQDGILVSLDGHGGDELCGGYFDFLNGMGALGLRSYKNLREVERGLVGRRAESSFVDLCSWARHSMNAYLGGSMRYTKRLLGILSPQDLDFIQSISTPYYVNFPAYKQLDPINKKFFDLYNHSILPTLLRNYDRFSMSCGVEVRSPFLDYRLAGFSFSLPSSSKIGGSVSKKILREAMTGIVPDKLRLRSDKISWLSPSRDWLRTSLRGDLTEYFTSHQNLKGITLLKRLDREELTYPVLTELWKNYTFGSV